MHIPPFATEQYFALYEFEAPYLLGVSDCESMTVAELLALAGKDLNDLGQQWLGYTETQGHPALRARIAGTYRGVQPDDVIITVPEEGIFLAFHALLEPGDEAIVLTPAYDSLRQLAEHILGPDQVHTWPMQPTPDGWRLDLDALEARITPRTRLLVVNFPHNPTGYLPTAAEFDSLLDIVARHNLWLFCDEMYRGLEFGARPRLDSAVERYAQAIVLSGLSKAQGLPGLRLGWLALRDPALRAAILNWKHYTTICPPAPVEMLAQVAMTVMEPLMARNRALVVENLALAEQFMARHGDLFVWRPPLAGSVALVEVHVPSAEKFCTRLVKNAGILLLPGVCLGAGDQMVRFGLGRRSFGPALAQLDQYLSRLAAP